MAATSHTHAHAEIPAHGTSTSASTAPGTGTGTANCFQRLRQVLAECLETLGATNAADYPIRGVAIIPDAPDATPITIPLFPVPQLTDGERVIVDAIRRAGEPLQQAELARATSLALRVIQKLTPAMVRDGKLLKHPSLGFYVPGQSIEDFPP